MSNFSKGDDVKLALASKIIVPEKIKVDVCSIPNCDDITKRFATIQFTDFDGIKSEKYAMVRSMIVDLRNALNDAIDQFDKP